MKKTRTLVLAGALFALAGCHRVVHAAEAPVRTTAHVVHRVVPHRR